MSAKASPRLRKCREFIAADRSGRLILMGVWKPGVEQLFEPIEETSADTLLFEALRADGVFDWVDGRQEFDAGIARLEKVKGLLRDPKTQALRMPILSADKLRLPKADKARRTPEQIAEDAEHERVMRNYRTHLSRCRAEGDTRPEEDIRHEYFSKPHPKRGRGAVTAGAPVVTPAASQAAPSSGVTSHEQGVTAASSVSLSPSEIETPGEGERDEEQREDVAVTAREAGPVTVGAVTVATSVTTPPAPGAPEGSSLVTQATTLQAGPLQETATPAPAPVVERRAAPRVPEAELTDEALGQQAVAILSVVPGVMRAGKTLPAVAEELGGVMRRLGFTLAHIHRVAAHWSVESPRVGHRGEKALFAWATTECRSGVSASFLAQNEGNALSIAVGAAEEFHKAREGKAAEAEAKRRKDAEWDAAQKARRDSASERAPPTAPPAPAEPAPDPRPGPQRAEDDPRLAQVRAGLWTNRTGTEGGE